MSAGHTFTCAHCGAEVLPEVPEYFIELECFRIIQAREEKIPRRGSKEYHETMERWRRQYRATNAAYPIRRKRFLAERAFCPRFPDDPHLRVVFTAADPQLV